MNKLWLLFISSTIGTNEAEKFRKKKIRLNDCLIANTNIQSNQKDYYMYELNPRMISPLSESIALNYIKYERKRMQFQVSSAY